MNIPYAAVNEFLSANPEMSAGQLSFERDGYYLHLAYLDGVQTLGAVVEEDAFWPEDGDTVHFLDATGRHVFVQRHGRQLLLLLEVAMPDERGEVAEFYKQVSEVHQPDKIDLIAVDLLDFVEFFKTDEHLNISALAVALSQHYQKGATMSKTADKIQEAGDATQKAVGDATDKLVDGVNKIDSAAENVAHSVKGKIEDAAETISDAGEAAAEAAASAATEVRASVKSFRPNTRDALFFFGGVGLGYLLKKLAGA